MRFFSSLAAVKAPRASTSSKLDESPPPSSLLDGQNAAKAVAFTPQPPQLPPSPPPPPPPTFGDIHAELAARLSGGAMRSACAFARRPTRSNIAALGRLRCSQTRRLHQRRQQESASMCDRQTTIFGCRARSRRLLRLHYRTWNERHRHLRATRSSARRHRLPHESSGRRPQNKKCASVGVCARAHILFMPFRRRLQTMTRPTTRSTTFSRRPPLSLLLQLLSPPSVRRASRTSIRQNLRHHQRRRRWRQQRRRQKRRLRAPYDQRRSGASAPNTR